MNQKIITLDVREDFAQGLPPCTKIQEAAGRLQPDEALKLITPFEPVPLFEVLGSQGFEHVSNPVTGGDWETLFTRTSETRPRETSSPAKPACGCGRAASSTPEVVEVDARHLEPPQPMVKILEALTALPAGAELRARTDRRPVHLYAALEARGFAGESEEQSDGSFITHIRRG
jgi:uncharacterized protein (DUF2249 family)